MSSSRLLFVTLGAPEIFWLLSDWWWAA